ncbi:MAG TPA: DUF4184 family protein [Nitrososphaera sp.]|jgi:hypothetical protein|nr:DUF4184 family protein [Nitrososphaera sp.]
MTLTTLHVAFVWMLKLRFRKLHFVALTVGAVIPDIEPLVAWVFGWSVFCGWDFPCSLAPDRLVLHSIVGAITIDVVLTLIFVKIIGKLGIERLGICGFSNVKTNAAFFMSAAIGSLSHVLVDWLHHPANPIFWPFFVDGSYYVDGLLLSFMAVLPASIIVATISAAITVAVIARTLDKSGYSFWLVLSNPAKALSLITESLGKAN